MIYMLSTKCVQQCQLNGLGEQSTFSKAPAIAWKSAFYDIMSNIGFVKLKRLSPTWHLNKHFIGKG